MGNIRLKQEQEGKKKQTNIVEGCKVSIVWTRPKNCVNLSIIVNTYIVHLKMLNNETTTCIWDHLDG